MSYLIEPATQLVYETDDSHAPNNNPHVKPLKGFPNFKCLNRSTVIIAIISLV